MNESIKKYAKIGLVHFMAYPATIKGEGPIEETVKKIAVDDYFEAIEVTWIKNSQTRRNVKKMLDSSHLTVAYGAQPRLLVNGLNINDLDEGKRQIAVNNLKEGIDEAYHAHMGNCMMTDKNDPAYGDLHPRFGYPGSENDVDELVDYLKVLMEIGYLDPDNRRILSFEVRPVGDEDPDIVVANAKRVLNLAWSRV